MDSNSGDDAHFHHGHRSLASEQSSDALEHGERERGGAALKLKTRL